MSRKGWPLFIALCVIWGIPYLLIRVAVEELSPPALVLFRTAPAALLLVPFALYRGQLRPDRALALDRRLHADRDRRPMGLALPRRAAPVELDGRVDRRFGAAHRRRRLSRRRHRRPRRRAAPRRAASSGSPASPPSSASTSARATRWRSPRSASSRCATRSDRSSSAGDWPTCRASGSWRRRSSSRASSTRPGLSPRCRRPCRPETVAAVATLALVCTALAFVLFFALILEVGPARSTVITYINPLVAVLLGVWLLSEPLHPRHRRRPAADPDRIGAGHRTFGPGARGETAGRKGISPGASSAGTTGPRTSSPPTPTHLDRLQSCLATQSRVGSTWLKVKRWAPRRPRAGSVAYSATSSASGVGS